jgi:hypothetical protein
MADDRIAEWNRLMLDWEVSLEIYVSTRKPGGRDEGVEGAVTDEALQRLIDLKRKIDDFVSTTRALRSEQRDYIVLGTVSSIQRRLDSILSAPDTADSPPAKRNKS